LCGSPASGIQTQAYSTSVLHTIRTSLTKFEVAGLKPASIVLHPTDFEGIELALSSTTAIEHLSLPYDAATRRICGVRIVTTVSEDAGALRGRFGTSVRSLLGLVLADLTA
jgi:hypothetical protein